MFLCDVWFQVAVVPVGFFQPAKSVGGMFAKTQEISGRAAGSRLQPLRR
jgi:hypothetical protein